MIEKFTHKIGRHCESSAMRDMFEFYGFPMSEAMAFGLDGTMGFGFFDNSNDLSAMGTISEEIPFFCGGKQDTITPNSLACRILGINLKKQSFSSANRGWEESKKMINNNIPLILRADIAYLPYMNIEEEIHFGGHTIVLAGYDEEKGSAFIGDTDRKGLQEISIEKLKQARDSPYGDSFMRPENTQFSMEPRSDGKRPPFAAGVKLAIKKVADHMLRPSISSLGLQGLKNFSKSILKWKDTLSGQVKNPSTGNPIKKAQLMFELIHGYIETWGTGGASFRNLYKEFLEELLSSKELRQGPRAWNPNEFEILKECISMTSSSAKNWILLAETLKNAADEYKTDCINQVDLRELHSIALNITTLEEELFTKLLKIKI
jgi:hypothetical protein